MESQEAQIENLQQQASAHYLQGEFQEALALWRKLLLVKPQDERALEGVRLCELLAEEGGAGGVGAMQDPSAATAAQPAAPAQSVAVAGPTTFGSAAEGFDEDLDDLEDILESGGSGNGDGGAVQAEAPAVDTAAEEPAADSAAEEPSFTFEFSTPGAVETPGESEASGASEASGDDQTPDPERQAEGIDFGDESHAPPLPLDVGTATVKLDASSLNLDQPPVDSPSADEPAAEDAADTEVAANELRSRVNELLAEALTNYENGLRDEALSVLNRIFILDETNDAAQALYENISNELEAERQEDQPSETAEDTPAILGNDTPEPLTDSTAAPALDETSNADADAPLDLDPGAQARVAQQAAADRLRGDSSIEIETPLAEPEPAVEETVETPAKRTGGGLGSGRNLILVAVILAVVSGGGYAAYTFLGGSGGSSDSAEADGGPLTAGSGLAVPAPEDTGPDAGQSLDGATNGESETPDSPAPVLDVAAEARIDDLLGKAKAAERRDDWAGAVMAYNRVLEIDPTNQTARTRLEAAGEKYREQKALDEKRREAIEAFNAENYRVALSILYRLPEGDDTETVERYKRNGWYNMGLQSLKAGDCRGAQINFKEARSIDPSDSEALLAVEMAKACRYSAGNDAYFREVDSLEFRALDD